MGGDTQLFTFIYGSLVNGSLINLFICEVRLYKEQSQAVKSIRALKMWKFWRVLW